MSILRTLAKVACLTPMMVVAAPYAPPDTDTLRVRHDLQQLVDSGILQAPLTSWPQGWGDWLGIAERAELPITATVALLDQLQRLQLQAGRAARRGWSGLQLEQAAATAAAGGSFGLAPADQRRHLGLAADWLGERFALRLATTLDGDDRDAIDKSELSYRLAGSWAGVALGNWMVAAGWQPAWWGPGWEGSLLLGSGSRPFPRIALQRNSSAAPQHDWLDGIGRWRFDLLHGELDDHRPATAAHQIDAARLTLRPLATLELGLSHLALNGGEGALQLQALDLRQGDHFDDHRGGYALYGQWLQRDRAVSGVRPQGELLGAELWRYLDSGATARLYLEQAITDNALYGADQQSGYRYYGEPIGHPVDSGGQLTAIGVIYVTATDQLWRLQLRRLQPSSTYQTAVSSDHWAAADSDELLLSHQRPLPTGTLTLGMGIRQRHADERAAGSDQEPIAWLRWRYGDW